LGEIRQPRQPEPFSSSMPRRSKSLAKDIKGPASHSDHARHRRSSAQDHARLPSCPARPAPSGRSEHWSATNVEVLVIGETREWETVEYTRDAVTEGKKKALIILGHVPSEESGMLECARWLKIVLFSRSACGIHAGPANHSGLQNRGSLAHSCCYVLAFLRPPACGGYARLR